MRRCGARRTGEAHDTAPAGLPATPFLGAVSPQSAQSSISVKWEVVAKNAFGFADHKSQPHCARSALKAERRLRSGSLPFRWRRVLLFTSRSTRIGGDLALKAPFTEEVTSDRPKKLPASHYAAACSVILPRAGPPPFFKRCVFCTPSFWLFPHPAFFSLRWLCWRSPEVQYS